MSNTACPGKSAGERSPWRNELAPPLRVAGGRGLGWALPMMPGAFHRLSISDAARHTADDPTEVSDCQGNDHADHVAAKGLGRVLRRSRLCLGAEPSGTVRWSHASLLLSVTFGPEALHSLVCGVSQTASRLRRSPIGDRLPTWERVGVPCRRVKIGRADWRKCDRL